MLEKIVKTEIRRNLFKLFSLDSISCPILEDVSIFLVFDSWLLDLLTVALAVKHILMAGQTSSVGGVKIIINVPSLYGCSFFAIPKV